MATKLSAAPRKNRRASAAPAASAAPSAPAPVGHNSMQGEEAERVQLISFVAQLTAAEQEIEVAKGPLKAAQKKRSSIVNLAKAAGFTSKELNARMDEMNRPESENALQFARESRHRRWLGTHSPEQQKMHLEGGTPREQMDELDWQARGYRDGLRNLAAKPPEGCPPRMDQPYLRGHEKGRAEYLASLEAAAPKPMANRAQEVAEQAARDFAADNPDHASIADDRLAQKRQERAVKAALEKLSEKPANEDDGEAAPEAVGESEGEVI